MAWVLLNYKRGIRSSLDTRSIATAAIKGPVGQGPPPSYLRITPMKINPITTIKIRRRKMTGVVYGLRRASERKEYEKDTTKQGVYSYLSAWFIFSSSRVSPMPIHSITGTGEILFQQATISQ